MTDAGVDGLAAVAHAFVRIAELSGGASREVDGVLTYQTPSTDPVVWNGALLTTEPVDPAAALARADAFFLGHRPAYGFWIVASRDDAMASFLREAGLEQVADDPHMVADSHDLSVPDAPDVDLAVVATEAQRLAFVECAARAFAQLGAEPSTWASVYPSLAAVHQDDVVAVVAMEGHGAVAGAMGYCHEGVCEVIHVATVPEARRRGLGAAVTAAVVAEAADRGSSHAVLQATSMGESTYRALGFREVDRFQLFVRHRPNEDEG